MPVPDYRKRRIVERLRELPHATIQDMEKLQYDVISVQARELLTIFLPHLPAGPLKSVGKMERTATIQSAPRPHCSPNSTVTCCSKFLVKRPIAKAVALARAVCSIYRPVSASRRWSSPASIASLNKKTPAGGPVAIKAALIRRAAEKLANEPDMPWGEFNSFHFVNRFFRQSSHGPLFRLRYSQNAHARLPCYSVPGSPTYHRQGETTFSPSYHFVTDLGTNEAWTNLPGGPSESRFSPFYKNDIIRWQTGTYKRLTPLAQPAVKADDSEGGMRAAEDGAKKLRSD